MGLQDLETWAEDRLRLVEDLATESSGPRGPVGIFDQKMGDPWGLPVESYGLRLSVLPEGNVDIPQRPPISQFDLFLAPSDGVDQS